MLVGYELNSYTRHKMTFNKKRNVSFMMMTLF